MELTATNAALGAAGGVVIIAGFEIYDRVVLPLVGAFAKPGDLPKRAKRQEALRPIDKTYILVNKVVTVAFVYSCVYFAATMLDCSFDDTAKLARYAMWFPATFVATIVVYDFFYTLLHWALHIPALYPWVHKHHHVNAAPFRGNTDAINVHPFEYFSGEFNHLLAVFVVCRAATVLTGAAHPMHCVSLLLYIFFAGTLSSLNHTRFDIEIPYVYSVWWHDYHHRVPRSNYGQYIMLWDYLFGTYFSRSGTGEADKKSRNIK
jgi:sterol desaturase/sphingolipid hydroxylase (fatty acid hydroxylase superfamily)